MRRILPFALLVLAAACTFPQRGGRYFLARDPGSRMSWRFVRDRESGQWVNRACELRVAVARALPEALVDPEHGSLLSVDMFKPGSIEGAAIGTLDFEVRDEYRYWNVQQVLSEHDLSGDVDYGLQVRWPEGAGPARFEPLELIEIPPLGDTPPEVWSEWMHASNLRAGGFGGIEEAQGAPAESVTLPEHPFEMRCRLRLVDNPVLLQ